MRRARWSLRGRRPARARRLRATTTRTSCPGPGPSKVDVDTPELRELKAEVGIEPCRPGPGGGALPAVTLPCLGGGTSVDLSTLRGPMVLNLWAAGCEPCREEMPVLQDFHEQYGDRCRCSASTSRTPYPGSALEEAGERGVTYPSLADPGGDLMDTDEFAKIRGLPMLYFVDADGRHRLRASPGASTRPTSWPSWSASTSEWPCEP